MITINKSIDREYETNTRNYINNMGKINLKDIQKLLKIDNNQYKLLVENFIDNAKAYLKETYTIIYAILDLLEINDDDNKLMNFLNEHLVLANFIDSTNSKAKELLVLENSIADGVIDLSQIKHKNLWKSILDFK